MLGIYILAGFYAPISAGQGPAEIAVVFEKDSSDAAYITQALRNKLDATKVTSLHTANLDPAHDWCASFPLVIAIGATASTIASKKCTGAVITSSVATDFERSLAGEKSVKAKILPIHQVANLAQQINLANFMIGEKSGKIFVVHSVGSEQKVKKIVSRIDAQIQAKIETIAISSPEYLVKQLKTPAESAAAFVFTDETGVIDPYNVRALLIMSARAGVPLFGGGSGDLVKAGFTAGLYYPTQMMSDIILATVRNASGANLPAQLPKPVPEINERLAKRYGLQVPDMATIFL